MDTSGQDVRSRGVPAPPLPPPHPAEGEETPEVPAVEEEEQQVPGPSRQLPRTTVWRHSKQQAEADVSGVSPSHALHLIAILRFARGSDVNCVVFIVIKVCFSEFSSRLN